MLPCIAVEHPERAKVALAALTTERARFVPAVPGQQTCRPDVLPVATALSVEAIIETACALGFHAEEIQRGIVEFWVDEGAAFELFTPESRASSPVLALAA